MANLDKYRTALSKIRSSTLLLFVCSFFLFPKLQTVLIAISFFTVLIDRDFFSFFSFLKLNKLNILMLVFFGVILLSFSYSNNIPEGLKAVETKFSLLVFPIFLPFIFNPHSRLKKQIISVFIFSGLIYILLSYFTATLSYLNTGNTSEFFYEELGAKLWMSNNFTHPTYFSFFYNILFAILGLKLIHNAMSLWSKTFYVFSMSLVMIFILMLNSKFGILALVINGVVLLVFYMLNSKKIIIPLTLMTGFMILVVVSVATITPLKNRFIETYSKLSGQHDGESSTDTRTKVWETTIELIKENPFIGVGAGDLRDELSKKYEEKGYQNLKEHNYDSHQQFLQTYAELGIAGIATLFSLFLVLFIKSVKDKNELLFMFTLLLFFFGVVESMLERQAGIVVFAFFATLLFQYNPFSKSPKS